jgi:outer membrane protein assembly factor BamB
MRGTRWLIVVFTLGLALLAGGIGEVAGSFADSETSLANSLRAWTSTAWAQTTQADFEVGIIPSQADTRSRPGDVGLAKRNRIFAFQGGSATFWAYGVPDNLWTSMTGTPNAVGAGGALAYDGLQYVYALRGNNTTAFWRYDTALNSWALRAAAPLAVGTGGALAYDGSSYIYALRGNNQTTFWRYDTVLNSWAVMATAPARVGAGAALTYDGSRYIYAFRGNNQTAFWRYDTALNSWAVMATAPARVGAGGALACDSLGYVYGFRGSNSTAYWKYNVLGNSWTAMANALGNVANGGALAFAGANTYVNTAAIASQVRDTGTVGAGWDGLFWDETLPLNTDITFEVRASDTLFAAGDVTPTWVSVGGTSPVTSGLPSGRYMQWRATLTTSDIMVTPLLNEVRVYYY